MLSTYFEMLTKSLDEIADAEAARETITFDWWHNEHEPQDVVSDIDQMIAETPDLPLLGLIDLAFFRVPEDALSGVTDSTIPLDQFPYVYRWRGSREEWNTTVRTALLTSFPAFGEGLLVAANLLARARPATLFSTTLAA